jgi:hypothetical protein
MDFGIAETGIARGSPPGTTTEVLRFGVPFAETRVVSHAASANLVRKAFRSGFYWPTTMADARI